MGRGPSELITLPPDAEERGITIGNVEHGRAMLEGRYPVGGQLRDLGALPWTAPELGDRERAALHRFDFLGDLAAVDHPAARKKAIALFEDWDEHFGTYTSVSWRADILAARLVNCLSCYGALFDEAETAFRARFLDSIARQLRHLRRVAPSEAPPASRIEVFKGLIYGEVCVAGEPDRLERALGFLEEEVERQILPDGSHLSRSPGRQLAILEALIDIRAVLTSASLEVPVTLRNAIDRMAPMVRFLRHGDGALACFHGGGRPDPAHVSRVLTRSDAQGRAPQRAPYARFERVDANGLTVILDGGPPPSGNHDDDAHAGMMSLEISVDGQRLFVNCGAGPGTDPEWREALRTTAAHSTLVVDDTNSCELTPAGIGRRVENVECDRGERDDNIWISSSHDGYEPRFGLTHRRRLYIDGTTTDLRGEDIVVGANAEPFAVRFHLHPAVQATMDTEPGAVILMMPNGNRWRLRTDRGIDIEDSVYWQDDTGIARSKQIVIADRTTGEATPVKWRLHRVEAGD